MDWRVAKTFSLAKNCDSRNGEPWSLTEAAKALNLSASRLRHIFKEQVGISPVQLVKSLRLQRARELLESTALSIKEVRTEAGFNDKSYFTRAFKHAFGLSPSVYHSQFVESGTHKANLAITYRALPHTTERKSHRKRLSG